MPWGDRDGSYQRIFNWLADLERQESRCISSIAWTHKALSLAHIGEDALPKFLKHIYCEAEFGLQQSLAPNCQASEDGVLKERGDVGESEIQRKSFASLALIHVHPKMHNRWVGVVVLGRGVGALTSRPKVRVSISMSVSEGLLRLANPVCQRYTCSQGSAKGRRQVDRLLWMRENTDKRLRTGSKSVTGLRAYLPRVHCLIEHKRLPSSEETCHGNLRSGLHAEQKSPRIG